MGKTNDYSFYLVKRKLLLFSKTHDTVKTTYRTDLILMFSLVSWLENESLP